MGLPRVKDTGKNKTQSRSLTSSQVSFVKCCEEDAGAETDLGIQVKGGRSGEDMERERERAF